MKAPDNTRKRGLLSRATLVLTLASGVIFAGYPQVAAATNVVLWDTVAPLANGLDAADRANWKAVPADLLLLEANPAKAASDPGYYGRAYSFAGDAVVENHRIMAAFWAAQGRVVLYSKADLVHTGSASTEGKAKLRKILEFAPRDSSASRAGVARCDVIKNANDEVVIEVWFGSKELSATFSFGKTEIVEIKPDAKLKEIGLFSPIDYGIVPSFVGDDLIVGTSHAAANDALYLPSENLLVGLLKGESDLLVMTWPKGSQRIKLRLAGTAAGRRGIEAVDFNPDGQSFYLTVLSAPGIWHREELKPAFLEKDVPIQWKRPFSAKWKTQLSEAGVKTSFAFREAKGQIWRGVPGSYNYPVWFEGDSAFFHLSKKVPPKGEALIYFLEGNDTPLSVLTPVDVLKATLGRLMSDPILDVAGRRLRTHHRRAEGSIHRACTCGYTEAIQAVFEAGEEVAQKDYIRGALDDMMYFVQQHVQRIDEYRRFADDLIKFLRAKGGSAPELNPFLERLEQIAQQIPDEFNVQKENMKSLAYAEDLLRQTMALTGRKDPNNLKSFLELLKAWRAMGGAQDYVVAQYHAVTRNLFQEAGYGSLNQPQAVEVAQEVRALCRQCLRNPDGYEIWANY